MGNSSENKSTQLGMNFSTAQNKLRKNIMFLLVQKCQMDNCFKCGSRITSTEELSIEHKNPWLNVDPELFWELDNIAFSHLTCNVRDTSRKIEGPEGYAWCQKHQSFIEVEKFSNNEKRFNGLQKYCKACESKRKR